MIHCDTINALATIMCGFVFAAAITAPPDLMRQQTVTALLCRAAGTYSSLSGFFSAEQTSTVLLNLIQSSCIANS